MYVCTCLYATSAPTAVRWLCSSSMALTWAPTHTQIQDKWSWLRRFWLGARFKKSRAIAVCSRCFRCVFMCVEVDAPTPRA